MRGWRCCSTSKLIRKFSSCARRVDTWRDVRNADRVTGPCALSSALERCSIDAISTPLSYCFSSCSSLIWSCAVGDGGQSPRVYHGVLTPTIPERTDHEFRAKHKHHVHRARRCCSARATISGDAKPPISAENFNRGLAESGRLSSNVCSFRSHLDSLRSIRDIAGDSGFAASRRARIGRSGLSIALPFDCEKMGCESSGIDIKSPQLDTQRIEAISHPMRYGFGSCLALIGFGLSQFWPYSLPISRPQFPTRHHAMGGRLDSRAVLHRDRSTCPPVGNCALANTDGSSQLTHTIGGGNSVIKCVHGAILITNVITTQHLCD